MKCKCKLQIFNGTVIFFYYYKNKSQQLGINFTLSEIQRKAKNYCTYQERSHNEVIKKLYSFGLRKADVDQTLSWLIESDYLNEERFAIRFAGGKFRMKKWGRIKVKDRHCCNIRSAPIISL
jgi:SOS response regulatory protein OraA/RecX